MTTKISLSEWVPGLDDSATLAEAHAKMPGDDASVVPWYVRLLENPASRVALPGAIDLFGHDCIHILLGRGTLSQDEAFVLGVTMGTARGLQRWQQKLFGFAAQNFYRGPWRLTPGDRLLFDMAVEFAKHQRIKPLNEVPWRELRDEPLGRIREEVGIRTADLIKFYETERAIWPDNKASQRLPVEVRWDE